MIKLYHGTTERIAKTAPMLGIQPYEVLHNDNEVVFSNPKKDTLHLTNIYAAFQAFSAATANERWGIIDVRWADLVKNLSPDSELMKGRGRKSWKDSIDTVGMCILKGEIPVKAIGKVIIYDPKSNWLITRSVLHLQLGADKLKEQQHQLQMLHRWLTGEFFFIEEWLGPDKDKFTKSQQNELADLLNNRSGLDVFYRATDA